MCDAAFAASFTACIDEIERHSPGFRAHLRDTFAGVAPSPSLYVNEYVQAVQHLQRDHALFSPDWFLSRTSRDMRELQRHLLKPRRKARAAVAEAYAKKLGIALYRRFLSASHPDCTAWVRAIPHCPANTLSNAEIGTAIRNRLLMPHPFIPAGRGCVCAGEHTILDQFGIHLEKCKSMHSLTIATHDALTSLMEQFLRCSGVRCRREVTNIFLDGPALQDKSRIDLVVEEPGQPRTLIDVSILSPVTLEQEHNMAGIPGSLDQNLKQREHAKETRYGDKAKAANMKLVPMCYETTGRPGPQCQVYFNEAVNRYHDRTGFPAAAIRQHWVIKIQLTIQRHVAQALIHRARRINCGYVPVSRETEALIAETAAALDTGQEGPGPPPSFDEIPPDPSDDATGGVGDWKAHRA